LVEIVELFLVELTDLISGDQLRRLVLLFQNVERARQISAGQVALPFLGVILVQVIAQVDM